MKTEKQIIESLQARVRNLRLERDKLRKITDEIEEYEAVADEAAEALEEAIERLSRLCLGEHKIPNS